MRRGFSIFLILLFGLGPLSAMVDGGEDTGLPLCCRRHGAHHCAMAAMAQMPPDPRTGFSAPLTCPYFPGSTIALLTPANAMAATAARLHVAAVRTETRDSREKATRSIPSDAHAGRGPPASTIS